MRFFCLASVALCVLLGGCDQAALMRKFVSPDDESAARGVAELLRGQNFEQIEHSIDPQLLDSTLRDTLSKMAAFFPTEEPVSVKIVGAQTSRGPEFSKADITLEYQFPYKWLLVNVVTQKKGDFATIVGLVTPLPDSLENLNRFTLAGKSALQYVTLICAIASLLFTFYVFVVCIRSKDMKPKWLWSIAVLTGVGYFGVNWRTGHWTYQVFAFQIPCFSMQHPFYGPWSVAAYFPLGAIAFLQRRWKMKITGESIPKVPSAPLNPV